MLELNHITKTYLNRKGNVAVLKDISIQVEKGEFISIVGPSGSGKTTILKIIAGLLEQTSGEASLDGKPISTTSRERGMVFQQFSLFPWMTVRENVAFGLKVPAYYDTAWEKKTDAILKHFGIFEFKNAYPKDLSGGMQQRVAIARTLIVKPRIILMDEPFGSLDAQTRAKMQEFLTSVYEETKTTIIFVTHDIEEAAFLSDKIYVATARPTSLKKVNDVPFPRPRLHSLKHDPKFFAYTVKIAEQLEN